jgi:hypothetical protein
MIAGPPRRDNPSAEQATIAVALGAHRDHRERRRRGVGDELEAIEEVHARLEELERRAPQPYPLPSGERV